MFVIFIVVAVLVGWALRLMQCALTRQEFSLMLAGFLVASSAAALVAVYYLMTDYMGYMSSLPPCSTTSTRAMTSIPTATPTSTLVANWQ
ncbi:MAG: hypothetical protein ACO4AI_02140 [Prochlorothrix sp.]|nr:hypothetical protein [Prochlorothrix sp.]